MDLNDVKFDFLDIIGETYSTENLFQTKIQGWDDALGGGFVKDNIHIIVLVAVNLVQWHFLQNKL